jgi:hypothetical protein
MKINPLLLLFILLAVSLQSIQAQSLYTRAQRARTPLMAKALLQGDQVPSSIILTLISRVYLWPKENVALVHEKSSLPLPEKYVILLANKYGTLDKNGKVFPEPLTPQELFLWIPKWEVKNKNTLEPWLKFIQPSGMSVYDFENSWESIGGEKLPNQLLDKYFDK